MDINNNFMASNISINLATSISLNEPIVNPNSNQFEMPVEEETEEEDEKEIEKEKEEKEREEKHKQKLSIEVNDDNEINFNQIQYDEYLLLESDNSLSKYRSIGEVAAAALLQERINHRRNAAILSDGKTLAIYQTQRKEEERKKNNYKKKRPQYKFANTLRQNREDLLYSQKRANYE
jgi:hypothetical protein